MMRLVDLRGQRLSKAGYTNTIPRAALDVAEAMKLVEPILARVKNGNEADLIELAKESINQKIYYRAIYVIKGWWFFNSEEKSRIEAEAKGYFYDQEDSELVNAIVRFNFFKNDYKNTEEHEAVLIDKFNNQIPYITDFDVFLPRNRYPEPVMENVYGIKNINKSELVKTKYIISEIIFNNDIYLNDIDSMRVYANKAIEIIKNQHK